MERKINRIKLFINSDKKSKIVAKKLKEKLINYHFEIVNSDYDLAISVGGDGSFLRMIKENEFNSDIYYIGINSGTLGFLQEIDVCQTKNFIDRLASNDYKVEELSIEENTIMTDDNYYKFYSLNEIVIRKKDFSILKIPVYVDNELLEHFTGDGILISTSTGSTAYNMSFGGSIIYNSLNTLSITPIAPLNNKAYRTLVNSVIIPANKEIRIISNNEDLFFMIDGEIKEINNVKKIEVKIASKGIKCLRMNDFHFIKIVNSKILEK